MAKPNFSALRRAMITIPGAYCRNSDNDRAIPKLPAPRKPSPDSLLSHTDSDPDMDEALRRVKVGVGR